MLSALGSWTEDFMHCFLPLATQHYMPVPNKYSLHQRATSGTPQTPSKPQSSAYKSDGNLQTYKPLVLSEKLALEDR